VARRWNEFIKKNFKAQIVENVWSFNTNLWPHKDKQTIATSKRVKITMEKNDYKRWEKNTMHIKFQEIQRKLDEELRSWCLSKVQVCNNNDEKNRKTQRSMEEVTLTLMKNWTL
jgi:hypothetical protein